MTKDEVNALAKEADRLAKEKETVADWVFDFARLVQNATLERVAEECDTLGDLGENPYACAAEIRKMKT